ncbi:MAG: ATP-binding protein [Bacteroidota bacterium]|nr:ATP-binding protein [Bacteroidota bacterium]
MAENRLIYTSEEYCIGCNKCNACCPVIYANYAYIKNSTNKISVDENRCIQCGSCMDICDHNARRYNDDTELFFNKLFSGDKISLIVGPSIRYNVENYKNLFGFLKQAGVNNIFDASYGGNITIWAYLNIIKQENLQSVIASPCTAIVSYIEKYKPELIKYLAPIQSPSICQSIFQRKYLGIEDDVAFLSPCIAKKYEFDDPNTHNNIQYNIAFRSIIKYLKKNNINLNDYPEKNFDNSEKGLGFLFSLPGGLTENLKFYANNLSVIKVDGTDTAYNYLDDYVDRIKKNKFLPNVVDILNCRQGCNQGSAAVKPLHIDDIYLKANRLRENRSLENNVLMQAHNFFDSHLNVEDFIRTYSDKSENVKIKEPTEVEYSKIFKDLNKETEISKNINCYSCGYGNCKDFAKAVFNGINHKNNCIYFNQRALELERQSLSDKNDEISLMLSELARINKDKEKSEMYIRAIIDSIQDVLIVINVSGMIELSNPAASKMFNYCENELFGSNITKLIPDFNIDAIEIMCSEYSNAIENIGIKKDKSEFPVEISLNLLNFDNKTTYIILIRDITDRKQIEKMKNHFVSVVSHELRTPITSIQGALGLLTDKNIIIQPDKSKKLVDIALKNSFRLLNLVNDILDIEKVNAGKMKFSIESFDAIQAVDHVLLMNKLYASRYNVHFVLETLLEKVKIKADVQRFEQVLINLLSNAAKFSPSGENIVIYVSRNVGMIRISVSDNGAGIPAEFQDRIFQKFAQSDSSDSRKKGGTGLGLSICKGLVENMGGNIGYLVKPEGGTTFFFELPEEK